MGGTRLEYAKTNLTLYGARSYKAAVLPMSTNGLQRPLLIIKTLDSVESFIFSENLYRDTLDMAVRYLYGHQELPSVRTLYKCMSLFRVFLLLMAFESLLGLT